MSDLIYDPNGAEKAIKNREMTDLEKAFFDLGATAERKRILGLEVMRDEVIEERNYILDECADDWEKGRNSLRQTLREAIGDSE